MIVAAVYARKSTEQNVSDEEKSITRQVERARAYAALKGWTVADEHVFSDDGISGGEFVKRPGLVRLISRLTPRAAVRSGHHGRTGWAPTGIREMLRRETYIGRVVWGKTRWVDRGGTKVKVRRPEAERLRRDGSDVPGMCPLSWKCP